MTVNALLLKARTATKADKADVIRAALSEAYSLCKAVAKLAKSSAVDTTLFVDSTVLLALLRNLVPEVTDGLQRAALAQAIQSVAVARKVALAKGTPVSEAEEDAAKLTTAYERYAATVPTKKD